MEKPAIILTVLRAQVPASKGSLCQTILHASAI